jgi:hypothetical protein
MMHPSRPRIYLFNPPCHGIFDAGAVAPLWRWNPWQVEYTMIDQAKFDKLVELGELLNSAFRNVGDRGLQEVLAFKECYKAARALANSANPGIHDIESKIAQLRSFK